jgi:aryl-alcohol dehydrogenase-like predicted oxidoreductase
MRYLNINSYGNNLNISRLVMGTDKLANLLNDNDLFNLMDFFIDGGGNCIDTARVYCKGASEEALGRWFSKRQNRSKIVLSTKGCHPPIENMPQSRLSKNEMQSDLEASLRALKTEYIDMYWLHRDDTSIPVEQIVEDINTFVKAGKVRLIGCSNWQSGRIEKANAYARKTGLQGFSSSQIQWSLGNTYEEIYDDYGIAIMNEPEYQWYLNNKMPVFAYGSQAQGFFSKVASMGLESLMPKTRKRYESQGNLRRLERAKEIANKYGISVSAAVLSYITCNRLPAAAIIGCKNIDQLTESLQAADIEFSPEEEQTLYGNDK